MEPARAKGKLTARTRVVAPVLLACVTLIAACRVGAAARPLDALEQDIATQALLVVEECQERRRCLPRLFFPTELYPPGHEPLTVYSVAAFSLLVPAVWAVRLPSVLLAIASVLLTYTVAGRLFHHERTAVFAAAALLVSPMHVLQASRGGHALFPVAFVLLAMWLVVSGPPRGWRAFAAGLWLGLGVLTHPSAPWLMALAALGVIAATVRNRGFTREPAFLVAGVLLPMGVGWLVWRQPGPDMISALAAHYALYDPALNPLQGVRDMSSYFGLSVRSYIYWQYFSPSVLFFAGEPVMFESRRVVGALLAPVGVLLITGLCRLVARRGFLDLLLVAGLCLPPVAAALDPRSVSLSRVMVMLPFAALTAGHGFEWFWERAGRRVWLTVFIALAVASAYQAMLFFTADYTSID